MSLDLLSLANTAVREAQLKGLEVLSQEQFDALFLMARGIGAIKIKYANDELGLYAALMQEDILSLLGIGLDQNYLLAKKQLEERINKRKEQLPKRSHKALDALYLEQLVILRKQFKVDQSIETTLDHFISNKDAYEQRKDGYTKHLSMSFIEEDIDVKVKRANESDAEFKTKQSLNAELTQYKLLRKDYLQEEAKIAQEFEEKVKALYAPVQEQIEQIERECRTKLEQHQRGYPKLTDAQKDPVEQEKEDKKFYELEAKREEIISERDEKIKQARESIDIEKDVKKLKEEKEEKSKQNKKVHSEKLNQAEVLFNDKILPLMKELKAQEAHKMFVVIANQMSSFIADHADALKLADSNTIAFVSLLKEMVSDLRIFGIVHHAGMKAAKEFVEKQADAIPEGEEEKKNFIKMVLQGAAEKAAKKVAKVIGTELGKAGAAYSKEVFAAHVEFLERNAALRVPASVKEHHAEYSETKTFVDFLPIEPLEEKVEKKEEESKSFFDFVDYYTENKGVIGGVNTAYQVYQALTARNPDLALVDASNPAVLFAKALEDDALVFSYKLLMEYDKLISTLKEEGTLGKNHTQWERLHENIKSLKAAKEALEVNFAKLKEKHVDHRKKYTDAKKNHGKQKEKIETLKKKREGVEIKIQDSRKARRLKEVQLIQEHLKGDKKKEMDKAMEKLEKEHVKNISKISENISKAERRIKSDIKERKGKIEETQKEAYKKFNRETEDVIRTAIKKEYEEQHGFLKAVLASDKDLEAFLKTSDVLQKSIASIQQEREGEREKLGERYVAGMNEVEAKGKDALLALEEDKKSKLEGLEKAKAAAINKILKPYQKINDTLREMDNQTQILTEELSQIDDALKHERESLVNLEGELVDISRAFYAEVGEFNELKTELNEKTGKLLRSALKLDPGGEPHLLAMQGMLKSP